MTRIAGGRLVLGDRGLALLARRDRAAVGLARRRWSAALLDPDGPFAWRNVSGRRSRQLLRNLEHTAAVHGFVAGLARQARGEGWEVLQLDPPHRASRYFRHGSVMRSVHPDAFGILRRDGEVWPFFPGVGAAGGAAGHDGGPSRPLPALLRLPEVSARIVIQSQSALGW